MNNSKILHKVNKLLRLYHEGKIPTLEIHVVHPEVNDGSRERYLYFTLPVSINFQRSSPAMWRSALATWNDEKTNYLFFPEFVIKENRDKVQKDLMKHKLALQRNKHTDIWIKLSETFKLN